MTQLDLDAIDRIARRLPAYSGDESADTIFALRERQDDILALIARIREICPHYSWSGYDLVDTPIGIKELSWRCDSCGLRRSWDEEIEEDHL
jgi:hypothetical protein